MSTDRAPSRKARALVLLVALAALPVAPTLGDPLFGDDYLHVENAARMPTRQLLTDAWVLRIDANGAWWTPPGFRVDYFRPVVAASFALDHALWGTRAVGYRLTDLALHVATTLLVWLVAVGLLGPGLRAWGAAALFAVHPCHAEAVAWVSARTDLLATLFFVAAYLAFAAARARPAWLAVGALAFALALGSKEMAVTLPLVLAAAAWRSDGKGRWAAPLVAAAVAAAYLVVRVHVLGGAGAAPPPFVHGPGEAHYGLAIALAPLVYLLDLALFVPPDPVVTFPFWLAHPAWLLAAAALAAALAVDAYRRAGDGRARAWALAWTGITILPVLPVAVGERFLYLPSVGYCVLLGAGLPSTWRALAPAQRRGYLALAALAVAVLVGKNLVMGALARHARLAIDDAARALDAHPDARALLVVDLPAASTLAFPSAVRLARPGRDVDVEILSIAPRFLSATAASTTVTRAGPRLVLHAGAGGFLDSYFARALAGRRVAFAVGEVVRRPGCEVRIVDVRDGKLRAFSVEPRGAAVLLRGDGFHVTNL